MLDRLCGARNFTNRDLRNAYHLISIKEGDEYKIAFRSLHAVRVPSHAVLVDERISCHTTKLQHQLEEISRRQSSDV